MGANALTIGAGATVIGQGPSTLPVFLVAVLSSRLAALCYSPTILVAASGVAYNIASTGVLALGGSPGTGNIFSFLNDTANTGAFLLQAANDGTLGSDTISGMFISPTPRNGFHRSHRQPGDHHHWLYPSTGTTGTITLSDGAVLNLTNLASSVWVPIATPMAPAAPQSSSSPAIAAGR